MLGEPAAKGRWDESVSDGAHDERRDRQRGHVASDVDRPEELPHRRGAGGVEAASRLAAPPAASFLIGRDARGEHVDVGADVAVRNRCRDLRLESRSRDTDAVVGVLDDTGERVGEHQRRDAVG